MLSYKHVSVSVSGTHILEDISIDFNDGNITTIVGPNGCGKPLFYHVLTQVLR